MNMNLRMSGIHFTHLYMFY